jgi:hypothetical protein
MGGELSPDRLYYWDGARWASAVSPDGAWRWDGHVWQPAGSGATRVRHSRAIIATVIAAAIVVGILGVFGVGSWAFSQGQALLSSSGVNVTCSDGRAHAGASVKEGDTLCGRPLGTSFYSADCVEISNPPAGGEFLDTVNNGDWTTIQVTPESAGCRLAAQPEHEVMFSTANGEPASATLIVDFVASGWEGGVGLQVACSVEKSCVDFSFWGDGYFSLDEGKPGKTWDNLTGGRMGSFGAPPVPKVGTENRLILRLEGSRVDVFLNGQQVTHGTTKLPQARGVADIYVDGRGATTGETVFLRRLFLFESVGTTA